MFVFKYDTHLPFWRERKPGGYIHRHPWMKGDGMELLTRTAEPRDREDLAEISRTTWEGHDYLEGVAESWLADSGFIVGELSGRVIACGKISRMPGDVAWLEGLRVHSDFRGRGLGRIMSDRILEEALRLLEEGKFTGIEFSTYINNLESISMAKKQGFRTTELFHVVGIEDFTPPSRPMELTPVDITPEDLAIYREHAPCGWKYIHARERDSLAWLRANAGFWQTPGGVRFLASKGIWRYPPFHRRWANLRNSLQEPGLRHIQ